MFSYGSNFGRPSDDIICTAVAKSLRPRKFHIFRIDPDVFVIGRRITCYISFDSSCSKLSNAWSHSLTSGQHQSVGHVEANLLHFSKLIFLFEVTYIYQQIIPRMKAYVSSFHLIPWLSKLDGTKWRNFEFEFVMSAVQACSRVSRVC